MLWLEFFSKVLALKFIKSESPLITHRVRKLSLLGLESLSCFYDSINKALLLVVQLIKGNVKLVLELFDLCLENIEVFIKELVTGKVSSGNGWSLVGLDGLFGDLQIVHFLTL